METTQWYSDYVRIEKDMDSQNLIVSEQIKNDANNEKVILDACDKWDQGNFVGQVIYLF